HTVRSTDRVTRVAEVLTCWPPGPEARLKRHSRSEAGTVTEPKVRAFSPGFVLTAARLLLLPHACASATGSVRRFVPVGPAADRDAQRHTQIIGRAHLPRNELFHRLTLAGSDLDHELVMDLQQHARGQAAAGQRLVDP